MTRTQILPDGRAITLGMDHQLLKDALEDQGMARCASSECARVAINRLRDWGWEIRPVKEAPSDE